MGEPSPPCCLCAGVHATVATTLAEAGAKLVPEAQATEATEEVVVAVSKSAAVLSALVVARETS